ncbi:hypothetical protein Pmani_005973 [Petrolisthes manimaculis]|uniref:Bicarbonate transporter-like transmembrane domain-containing protein n=1 Tax=Petrolisthes manimaculis TaxID=1843537 RepID=A0AAE1UGZ4_9EUCA|nr:hypothetical protein Pmani_005973 [Petrolisthes manimaculis]
MSVKHHPNVHYVKKVRTWKMHSFTGIQLIMLIILWVVKQSPVVLCFPFVLMLLSPIRLYLLPYGFNNQELSAVIFPHNTHKSGTHISKFQAQTHTPKVPRLLTSVANPFLLLTNSLSMHA